YSVETFHRSFTHETSAFGINDAGEVLGVSYSDDDGRQLFHRSTDGEFQVIPKVNWDFLIQSMVTEQFEVVGTALRTGHFEPEWGVVDSGGIFQPFDLTGVTNVRWVGRTADGRLFG